MTFFRPKMIKNTPDHRPKDTILDKQNQDTTDLQARVNELKAENQELKKKTARIDNMESKVKGMEDIEKSEKARAERLEMENAQLEARIGKHTGKIDALKQKHSTLQKEKNVMIKEHITRLDEIKYVSNKIRNGDAIPGETNWWVCPNKACPLMRKYKNRIWKDADEITVHDTFSQPVNEIRADGCRDLEPKCAEECTPIDRAIFDSVVKRFKRNDTVSKWIPNTSMQLDKGTTLLAIKRQSTESKLPTTMKEIQRQFNGKKKRITTTKQKRDLKSLGIYVRTLVTQLLEEWINAEERLRDVKLRLAGQEIQGLCNVCHEPVQGSQRCKSAECQAGVRRRLLPLSYHPSENVSDDEYYSNEARHLLSPHFRRLFELRDAAYQRGLLRRLRNQSNEKQRNKNSS